MKELEEEIAVCGLLCHECSIYLAHSDKEQAEKVRGWFIEEGFIRPDKSVEDFMEDGPYCLGCHGAREDHWSPTCWILNCCVDKKKQDDCRECSEFPCKNLEEWSTQNENYSEALKRLKTL